MPSLFYPYSVNIQPTAVATCGKSLANMMDVFSWHVYATATEGKNITYSVHRRHDLFVPLYTLWR